MSMVGDSYGTGDVLPGRAIYPSSRLALYIGLLSAAKFFRAIGLFISYDLLKLVPVVQFVFILKAGSALPLVFLQKPFTSGRRLSKAQWFRIARHAFFGSAISFLWLFGLTQCGPLRTILLFEHADFIIIAAATALFSSGGGPSKLRGAVFFLVAVVTLLLFDHDEKLDHMSEHEPDHIHGSFFHHLFNHVVTLTGMSDHKGGVVLLFMALCLQVGYNSAAKKLSVEVGGGKRLHALSTTVASLLLLPWASFSYLTRESEVESWMYLLFPMMLVVLFVGVVDFYLEAVAVNHLQPAKTAMYGTLAMFLSALFLSYTWNHPYVAQATTLHKLSEVITEDHVLSGGVIFSLMVFLLATRLLSSPGRMSKGSFIGFSAAGLPLYSFTGDVLAKTSQSLLYHLKNFLKEIVSESDSRRIFYFLCVNLSFTFVELVYGVWTNSLGLISDGFHMLFDCSALVMGLYAAIMSRWKPTRIFSYGYDRVEVLSGFVNGLFLVVIAIFVFAAAMARLFEPPEIKTERLLTVSVLGLLVNLVGIFAFHGAHHGHSHGGGASRQQECSHSHGHSSHGHSHGHSSHSHSSHSHSSHGHSHAAPSHHGHSHNANMEGVFLHILADTMGSVGVIISTLLIENFGWNIADPICSLFIAALIFLSVIPLFKETAVILLLRTPVNITAEIAEALQKVLQLEGVLAYRDPHFWSHTPSKTFGTLHLQIAPDANEQKIITQVNLLFKDVGLQSLTMQVEKEAYFQHLTGLGAAFDQMVQHTQNFQALNFDTTDVKAV